jgi:spheroidene monooxygenase
MATQTAVLCLMGYGSESVFWGFSRLVIGKYSLKNIPGLEFFRILGSGKQGGFDVAPSFRHQGLFCVFSSEDKATNFLQTSSVIKAYREHSNEFFSVLLQTYSSRGSWSKFVLPETVSTPHRGSIAAITRASIRPTKAFSFWQKAPPAEVSLKHAQGCQLAAGLGEAPYFRQATFTIWQSIEAMNDYARQGAHLAAIKAAHSGNYFSESMFTRFMPINPQGVWRGKRYE